MLCVKEGKVLVCGVCALDPEVTRAQVERTRRWFANVLVVHCVQATPGDALAWAELWLGWGRSRDDFVVGDRKGNVGCVRGRNVIPGEWMCCPEDEDENDEDAERPDGGSPKANLELVTSSRRGDDACSTSTHAQRADGDTFQPLEGSIEQIVRKAYSKIRTPRWMNTFVVCEEFAEEGPSHCHQSRSDAQDEGAPAGPHLGPEVLASPVGKDGIFLGLAAMGMWAAGVEGFSDKPPAEPGFRLADSRKGKSPILLLMQGFPGSGKSTLAHQLARTLRWPLIDKDDARNSFECLEYALSGGPEPGKRLLNDLSYQVMWNFARRQLACNINVIVDCPLMRAEVLRVARDIAIAHASVAIVVRCNAEDEELWKDRVEQRAKCLSQQEAHKPTSWEHIGRLSEKYGDEWKENLEWAQTIVVNTTALPPEQIGTFVIEEISKLVLLNAECTDVD